MNPSMCCSSSWGAPKWAPVPSGTEGPLWLPCGITSPATNLLHCELHGATGPARTSVGFPYGHSLLQAPSCSIMGSFTGCRWISAPLWASVVHGVACVTMGCRGISVPVPGALLHSSFTNLEGCRAVPSLSSILTPLSVCSCPCPVFFSLKYIIPEVLLLSLMGSTLAISRSIFKLAGVGFTGHSVSF